MTFYTRLVWNSVSHFLSLFLWIISLHPVIFAALPERVMRSHSSENRARKTSSDRRSQEAKHRSCSITATIWVSYGTHGRTAGRLITKAINYGQFVCIIQVGTQVILNIIGDVHCGVRPCFPVIADISCLTCPDYYGNTVSIPNFLLKSLYLHGRLHQRIARPMCIWCVAGWKESEMKSKAQQLPPNLETAWWIRRRAWAWGAAELLPMLDRERPRRHRSKDISH